MYVTVTFELSDRGLHFSIQCPYRARKWRGKRLIRRHLERAAREHLPRQILKPAGPYGTGFADSAGETLGILVQKASQRETTMKRNALWIFAAMAMITLASCHKAESPATVQRDLAQARDAAANQEAKAYEKAADTVNSTNQKMAMESQKADQKAADAAYDVAIARADGDHKIAIAKCEGLSGNAHKSCVNQADAARDVAKAKAEAAKADHT
jgi:hypothetical protein